MSDLHHHYIDRERDSIYREKLVADKLIGQIYSDLRESSSMLFRAVTTPRFSRFLAFLHYDCFLARRTSQVTAMIRELDIDLDECLLPASWYDSPRKLFTRQIRYDELRPLDDDNASICSPSDARVLLGSLQHQTALFIKEKFFLIDELLGIDRPPWYDIFRKGFFALFRLTPDKYHYNHVPVSGVVRDIYEIDGFCHSCNPSAIVELITPYSKNRRTITVIDTDVPGGSDIGFVAMIEVAALMIGKITQCYSRDAYDDPQPIHSGMFLEKGQPKSLFHPGSSVTILLFQDRRIRFSEDLIANQGRTDVPSRFSEGFGKALVETDVKVRSTIGHRVPLSKMQFHSFRIRSHYERQC